MSDTPRTDEAKWETAPAAIVVSIYFAQTLERENVVLREQLKDCSAVVDRQQEMLDRKQEKEDSGTTHWAGCSESGPKHYKCALLEIARLRETITDLRDALSRLVEVHDAMGGKCGTVRIAAEEALLGKAQSEYICTCGIRVTPHKCPANDGF